MHEAVPRGNRIPQHILLLRHRKTNRRMGAHSPGGADYCGEESALIDTREKPVLLGRMVPFLEPGQGLSLVGAKLRKPPEKRPRSEQSRSSSGPMRPRRFRRGVPVCNMRYAISRQRVPFPLEYVRCVLMILWFMYSVLLRTGFRFVAVRNALAVFVGVGPAVRAGWGSC